MNDFQRIVKTLQNRDETCALATVVFTEGSTYRHKGARMLLFADGTMIGAISGGCLENDVLERALSVMETGQAQYILYDGSDASNNELFGDSLRFGMGCNGKTGVLIERLSGYKDEFIRTIEHALQSSEILDIATIFEMSNHTESSHMPALSGIHAFRFENGGISDAFGEDSPEMIYLAERIAACLDEFAATKEPVVSVCNIQSESGAMQEYSVLLERLPPVKELVIFGAGYDSIPLVDIASKLGWNVTIADARPAFLTKERFPTAQNLVRFHTETLEDVTRELRINTHTAAIVMTHHLERDAEVLRCILPQKPLYCGLLGPKERFAKIQKLWKERRYKVSKELLRPLYTPIGLDIGAETAEEVALSILSELQAVMRNKKGTPLKHKRGRIHDDEQ